MALIWIQDLTGGGKPPINATAATKARMERGVKFSTIFLQYSWANFPKVSRKEGGFGVPGGGSGGFSSSWGAAPMTRPTVFKS